MEAASMEVDQSLLAWSLSLSVLQRLRAATKSARTLDRLQRRASQDR